MTGEKLLKARDVAELLGVEIGTVLDRWEAGDIPGFRLYGRKGGPVRFRLSELEEWLETTCRPGSVYPDKANGAELSPAPRTGGYGSHATRIVRLRHE